MNGQRVVALHDDLAARERESHDRKRAAAKTAAPLKRRISELEIELAQLREARATLNLSIVGATGSHQLCVSLPSAASCTAQDIRNRRAAQVGGGRPDA